MNCKICNHESSLLFNGEILSKHNISYFKCPKCDFIQTEEPYWLNEAYSEAITELDIGYVTRNIRFSQITHTILKHYFDKTSRYLDYGGGYGMYVRMMRDRGYDFYRQDIYCQNLYANYFDLEDIKNDTSVFEAVTAFEVFEHLVDPMSEIEKMFSYGDTIIFSTEIQPANISSMDDWWYFIPETGQHISLFSKRSLEEIAQKFDCNLYTSPFHIHMLTKKKFSVNPVKMSTYYHAFLDKLLGRNFLNKHSLLETDYKMIKEKLNS